MSKLKTGDKVIINSKGVEDLELSPTTKGVVEERFKTYNGEILEGEYEAWYIRLEGDTNATARYSRYFERIKTLKQLIEG